MCGRYIFKPADDFYKRFHLINKLEKLESDYNITPAASMPVIIKKNPNYVVKMRWGLIPSWAKDPSIGQKLINARAETIAEKPSFRHAFKSNRCLIPSNGFYEWKKTKVGKIPYFIHRADNKTFSFAGIYERWLNSKNEEVNTYAIITCSPNSLVKPIHDRMPVILSEKGESKWLDTNSDANKLLSLLKPFDPTELEAYSISLQVNNPVNNSDKLLTPVDYPQS